MDTNGREHNLDLPPVRRATKTYRDTYPSAVLRDLRVSVVKFCLSFVSIRGFKILSASICVYLRLGFLPIRGIETLNDSDESLLHSGIRQIRGLNTALQGVGCVECNKFPAID